MFLVARHLNNGTWKKKNKNNKRRISKKTTKIAEHEESKFSANKRSIFVSFFNSSSVYALKSLLFFCLRRKLMKAVCQISFFLL